MTAFARAWARFAAVSVASARNAIPLHCRAGSLVVRQRPWLARSKYSCGFACWSHARAQGSLRSQQRDVTINLTSGISSSWRNRFLKGDPATCLRHPLPPLSISTL